MLSLYHIFTGKRREGKEGPTIDDRGEVVGHILASFGPGDPLWDRLTKAVSEKRDNELVRCLAKIPREPAEQRADAFRKLNALGEKEFGEAVELLRHNVITQFFERMTLKVPAGWKDIPAIRALGVETAEKSMEWINGNLPQTVGEWRRGIERIHDPQKHQYGFFLRFVLRAGGAKFDKQRRRIR